MRSDWNRGALAGRGWPIPAHATPVGTFQAGIAFSWFAGWTLQRWPPRPELSVRIGRGSGCCEYVAKADTLQECLRRWGKLIVPLDGGEGWSRVDFSDLDVARIDWIEIHVWCEKPGTRLSLSNLQFKSVALSPQDPDRRAAEWMLGIGGRIRISGREGDLTSLNQLPPKTPFKVLGIYLDGNQPVTDDGLENIENLTECTEIVLWGTRISDKGLRHLKGLPKLRSLMLSETRVSGRGLIHAETFPSLQTLHLIGCDTNDNGMRNVGKLTALVELEVGGTATDEGFRYLERLKELQHLRVMTNITDASLSQIAKYTKLWSLSIHGSGLVTKTGLAKLKGMPLVSLRFGTAAFDEETLGILESLPKIGSLYVNAPLIRDDHMMRLTGIPTLGELFLNNLNDEVSFRRVSATSNLHTVRFHEGEMNDDAIKRLSGLGRLRGLRQLTFNNVVMSKGAEAKLRAALPNCEIYNKGKKL